MAESDLIARVYVYEDVTGHVAQVLEASSYYKPPRLRAEVQPRRDAHEPTPEPTGPSNVSASDYTSCLELRFSTMPRTHHGLVFGSDPKSDVVLPLAGISWHHFTLTFDDARRLIVEDRSLLGTEVTYDNQGHGKRSRFQWIVGGDPTPQHKTTIIISLHDIVKFRIVVTPYNPESQAYINQIDRFRQGIATAENLFRDLDIPPETERPTGAHTPGTGEIYLEKLVGNGSFAIVTHFWNVSTGNQYAFKKPLAKLIQTGQVNVNDWRNEAHIMSLISHVRISF